MVMPSFRGRPNLRFVGDMPVPRYSERRNVGAVMCPVKIMKPRKLAQKPFSNV